MEDRFSTALNMVGGKIDSAVSGREYGVGVRIFQGNNYVYAYSNDYSRDNLIKVAKEAAAALPGSSSGMTLNFMKHRAPKVNVIGILPHEVDKQGFVDDLTVTLFVLRQVIAELPEYVVLEHWSGDPRLIPLVRRLVESSDAWMRAGMRFKMYTWMRNALGNIARV